MKNKGFTLIELLAVIAILAIILLIATPMVLNTITSSRTNSAKASAKMAWDAAQIYISEQISNGSAPASPVTFANWSTKLPAASGITVGTFNHSSGQITGIATALTITINGTAYSCTGATKAAVTCV